MEVIRELERYVGKVLGVEARALPWEQAGILPFFLRDAYDLFLLHLHGRDFLLMMDAQKDETSPATIRKHAEQLKKAWAGEVIYVREQVTSYNRNRLIQNKIPFIVPGNQLYLPMLAMDLREHFVSKRTPVKKLSPAAQVLVLYSIYKHRPLFDDAVTMTDWAAELGYTKMTMTRAFREIRSILEGEDELKSIRGRELWDRLRPYLRSPVTRRRYYDVNCASVPKGAFVCGDGALAHYTMMAEPNHMAVCMSATTWKKFQEARNPVELSRSEPDCLGIEVWRYVPKHLAKNGVVDPLSVYLSYEKNTDGRVEMALEDLLEDVQW